MKVISWDHDVSVPHNDLKGGVEYLTESVNAGGWLGILSYGCSIRDFNGMAKPPFDNLDGKRLLIMRPGGIGDIMFLSPTLRELKKRWPTVHIGFSVWKGARNVLEGSPLVDELLPYPVTMEQANSFDHIMGVEDLIEHDPRGSKTHAVDLYGQQFGLDLTDKRMSIDLSPAEKQEAVERFPKGEAHRFGIQLFATSMVRVYPHIVDVVGALAQRGHEIFCFGAPGQQSINQSTVMPGQFKIRNTQNEDPPLTFRQSAALAATCDCIIAPDSAMTHIAGALDVPCVALYGSFDWRLRTAYAPKTFAMVGHASCAPCFHHSRLSQMPANGLCQTTKKDDGSPLNKCVALGNIDPARVVTKAETFAHEKRRSEKFKASQTVSA